MGKGMIRKWLRTGIWTFLLLFPVVAFASRFDREILFVGSQYTYVREMTNRNDHPDIDIWLKYCGLDNQKKFLRTGEGYSYCAAFGCYVIYVTYKAHNMKSPFFHSAGCADILTRAKKDKYTYRVITPKQIFIGAAYLEPADVIIWSHNKNSENSWNGHFGFNYYQINNNEFKSLEANTINKNDASGQREQAKGSKNVGGVYYKNRKLGLGTTEFPVEGIIRIQD